MTLHIVGGLLLLSVAYLVVTYNSFVKLNNSVKESFSNMDVYLKKRWDLIPNLVELVKGYIQHESSVMQNITRMRIDSYNKMSLNDKIDANEKLSVEISGLFAIAENYPSLIASQNFSDLNKQLSIIEDEITQSRKYYNAIVKRMNTKIEMFPSNVVAVIFRFSSFKMFEAMDRERGNIEVKL